MGPALRRALAGRLPGPFATSDVLTYSRLSAVAPADFDQGYLLAQIAGHLSTLSAFQTEAEQGSDPALRALARKWMPTIQAHLQLAVGLMRHVGGESPFKPH